MQIRYRHTQIKSFLIRSVILVLASWFGVAGYAQTGSVNPDNGISYRYVERTIFVKEPVTLEKWVEETQFETQTVKEYRPVVETEKRERRTVVKKPVTRTTMKEQRTVVQKPVTETRYREREIQETSYDYITEVRTEQVTVPKSVIETRYREEPITIRQKITEDLIEVKNETVYKPQTSQQTVFYPAPAVTQFVDPNARPRMEWLQPGYYTDPLTGQSVWRRRGLHWVQPNATVVTTNYMPSTVEQTVLVPETVQTRRPVEVSRYVDRTETRRVPYDVERVVHETVSRQVPITVKRPVVKRSVEQVPYTETRYVDVEEVREIPVTETVYEESVEIEPYEVQVERWKEVSREVQVPRTVRRRVEYEEMREVAKKVWVKVPIDREGRALSLGEPVSEEELRSSGRYSGGYRSTTETSSRYQGEWESRSNPETAKRPHSVLVEESGDRDDPPMQPIERDRKPSTADEKPTLNQTGSQNEDAIRNLSVLKKPTLDLDVRPAQRPALDPNHREDVLSSERR
jgi:hypothetical protein